MATATDEKLTRRTTKILAIGKVDEPITPQQRAAIMPQEVPDTVRLYLDGVIDQWFGRPDGKGVVFILNLTSLDQAHTYLSALPLAKEHLMNFELIELGPLFPLRLLLTQ
ncbi:hypothetical protein HDF16_002786 [Granulicella aggregans]|uniref:Muconolactone delta-isomerase n=1 Tax=Granulicella aggregans TaxID=474949 RepID=A0A7W7ZDV6_9BACT|nr:hypothetical protein [Granulicella aggregans]MBB5058080.1 hypothetical protein [Granulicella aggregans]